MKKILFFFCVLLCAAGLLTARASAEAPADASRLPGSLQKIGEEAFAGTAMERLELPGSLLSIGRGAFADMPNLREILFSGPARMITGHGPVRLDAGSLPFPSADAASGWSLPAAVPPGNGSGQAEENAEPADGTGEEPQDKPRRGIFPETQSEKRPRDRAAFHPLSLYFP